jgi:hypothetical protein
MNGERDFKGVQVVVFFRAPPRLRGERILLAVKKIWIPARLSAHLDARLGDFCVNLRSLLITGF